MGRFGNASAWVCGGPIALKPAVSARRKKDSLFGPVQKKQKPAAKLKKHFASNVEQVKLHFLVKAIEIIT